ncbi:hypothetical protein [Lutimonas saemankumensis]|uniref:hypothetical protein n=1 Tax=Lutimonas saemankumensis TaxID=483016 RepID=UPI00293D9AEC|nr:hypothetical protein [Lutimonas saemankumensis]
MEKSDALFLLVKSLTKSEKRQFKLYAGRLGGNSEKNFIALFSILDKQEVFDEKQILAKTNIKKQQLSNSKAHLYRQILVSLKLNPIHKNAKMQVREQLDFATILFNKGLHKQSLKVLDKAKSIALANEDTTLAFSIVELEKVVESQYITRSLSSRADDLISQSKDLGERTLMLSKLSNLSLQLYSMLLKKGYVSNDKDFEEVKTFFKKSLPEYDIKKLGLIEKLYLYKAYLWYSFIVQDFVAGYRYAQKWVDLFYYNPEMKRTNPVFYLKGINYLLESLFLIQHLTKFRSTLNFFEDELNHQNFLINENTESLAFLYLYLNKINLYFLEGNFNLGLDLIPEVLEEIESRRLKIDDHHVMVFYYKFASLYFGASKYDQCIFYLDKIIKNRQLGMREDLLCFTRILNLVAHYEAGMDQNLEALIKSTYKFLIKMNELHLVQQRIISFLRNLSNIYPHELKNAFVELHKELKVFENHPYEKRSFMYLDIISWLESKIENVPVETIIKQKSKYKYK